MFWFLLLLVFLFLSELIPAAADHSCHLNTHTHTQKSMNLSWVDLGGSNDFFTAWEMFVSSALLNLFVVVVVVVFGP